MRPVVRAFLGLLVAASFSASVFGVFAAISSKDLNAAIFSFGVVTLLGLPFSAMVSFALGGPIYLVLSHYGQVTKWSSIAAGVCVGAICAYLFAGLAGKPSAFAFIPLGAAAGFIFWLVWKPRNPGAS